MKYLIFTIFLSLNFCYAENNTSKKVKKRLMSDRWYRLNKLIHQEIKTIKGLGKLGPKLTYRLMELYTEKLKLIKEKENTLFLKSLSSTGKMKEKSEYFSESAKLYEYTHKIGKYLVVNYPNFIHTASIFYTMALNSREYGKGLKTENYLIRALKNSPKNSPNDYNIKTNLAEYYYNEKNYEKAVYFYKDILKKVGNEWHSKHLYNAAWSFLKLKDYDEALIHLHLAYHFSKKKGFLSIEDQVLNSLGLFYVYAKNIRPGVDFYIKNVSEPAIYLISMSSKAADKLGQEKSEFILRSGLKNSKLKKQLKEELLIRTALLDHYRIFKKFNHFYKNSVHIYNLNKSQKISKDFMISSIEKIKSLVGYLQVRLSNNMKKDNINYDKKKLTTIIQFFKILSGLDPKNKDQYYFYQGETYFSVQNYHLAAKKYIKALGFTLKKKSSEENNNLQKKVFNSLFATISEGDLPKEITEKYTIFAYEKHLKIWPIDVKSQLIYTKLYNIHLKNSHLDKSLKVLNMYIKNYKEDIKKHRAMLSSIIDVHIKNENTDRIAHWVNKMEKGHLSFGAIYIEKATAILSSILFNQLQKIEDSGKSREAKLGYFALYKNKKYPQEVKAKSSFKLALLELEKGHRNSSFKWFKVSEKLQSEKEFKNNLNIIDAIQESYFKQLDFKKSIAISKTVIKRLCHQGFTQKTSMINNIVHFSLLENNYKRLLKNIKEIAPCIKNLKAKESISINVLTHLKNHRLYDQYFSFIKNIHLTKEIETIIQKDMFNFYWDQLESKSSNHLKLIIAKIKAHDSKDPNSKFQKILIFNQWNKETKNIRFTFKKSKKFNEEEFNKDLEKNILILKNITDQGALMAKGNIPQIILPTYKVIIHSYENIANAISHYTPQGVPEDFVNGFKNQMQELKKNLLQQSNEYHSLAKKLINDKNILTRSNTLFSNLSELKKKYNFRYPSSYYITTMDNIKGGI